MGMGKCLAFVEDLVDALSAALFLDDDIRRNYTTVLVKEIDGNVPCANSTLARRLETVISYEVITVISYSGDQDLEAQQEVITGDTIAALSLEKLQPAFATPEIVEVFGDATLGEVSIENNTGTGENVVETAGPTTSRPPSASPTASPIAGKGGKTSKQKASKKSKKSKASKTTTKGDKEVKVSESKVAKSVKGAPNPFGNVTEGNFFERRL